ncbi:MAG TPA: hypothetical protein VH188_11035 [Chthoniobacterales bacterium]|nr:hypothetical protein [Chthoniobacterales bacterium]
MNLRSRNLITVGLWLLALGRVCGQGGPPMITDDPGTPGNGKFEINLALAFEHRPGETMVDSPAIDINYGVGDRIQLTLQGGPVLLKRNDHGVIGGLGGTEAAVKWRFIDDQETGVTMSMFPRVLFNISRSAARRGLAEDGTRFQIPFQFAKAFSGFDLDLEWGPLVSTVGPSEWLYGIVLGKDVSKTTTLMAELHGTSRTNFSDDVLTLNFGIRQKLNDHCIFIGSLGHELRSPEARALIGYAGVQLLF